MQGILLQLGGKRDAQLRVEKECKVERVYKVYKVQKVEGVKRVEKVDRRQLMFNIQ